MLVFPEMITISGGNAFEVEHTCWWTCSLFLDPVPECLPNVFRVTSVARHEQRRPKLPPRARKTSKLRPNRSTKNSKLMTTSSRLRGHLVENDQNSTCREEIYRMKRKRACTPRDLLLKKFSNNHTMTLFRSRTVKRRFLRYAPNPNRRSGISISVH